MISTTFYSCDGKIEGDDTYSNSSYFEINFRNQNYISPKSLLLTGDNSSISTLPSFNVNFPEIQTLKYKFQTSLFYVNNDSDFIKSKTGTYRLIQTNNGLIKNLDFSLDITDKNDASKSIIQLDTIGSNKITEIKLISKTAIEYHYLISGSFDAKYINTSTNDTLPVTGKYSVMATTYK